MSRWGPSSSLPVDSERGHQRAGTLKSRPLEAAVLRVPSRQVGGAWRPLFTAQQSPGVPAHTAWRPGPEVPSCPLLCQDGQGGRAGETHCQRPEPQPALQAASVLAQRHPEGGGRKPSYLDTHLHTYIGITVPASSHALPSVGDISREPSEPWGGTGSCPSSNIFNNK